MATTTRHPWVAQLRWATLAALGTAALTVNTNEAHAAGADASEQPVPASPVEQAITEVIVSDQRIGWFEGIDAVRVQIDNDLFAGDEEDRDYTGGMSITVSGERARDGWLSLDPLLRELDDLSTPQANTDAANVHYARQIGLMAFTPSDTLVAQVQPDDRPYASLLFASNGRIRVDADDRGAWTSSVTIGVLGLSVTENLHGAVHELVGSERPRGYDHQISAGGEPTARYTLARQKLWIADPSGLVDVKTT